MMKPPKGYKILKEGRISKGDLIFISRWVTPFDSYGEFANGETWRGSVARPIKKSKRKSR